MQIRESYSSTSGGVLSRLESLLDSSPVARIVADFTGAAAGVSFATFLHFYVPNLACLLGGHDHGGGVSIQAPTDTAPEEDLYGLQEHANGLVFEKIRANPEDFFGKAVGMYFHQGELERDAVGETRISRVCRVQTQVYTFEVDGREIPFYAAVGEEITGLRTVIPIRNSDEVDLPFLLTDYSLHQNVFEQCPEERKR